MNPRDAVSLRQAGERQRQKSGEPSAESWREAFELLRGEGESRGESAPSAQNSETVHFVSSVKTVMDGTDCPSPPTPLPGVPGRGENLQRGLHSCDTRMSMRATSERNKRSAQPL